jgi:hypothetical protein
VAIPEAVQKQQEAVTIDAIIRTCCDADYQRVAGLTYSGRLSVKDLIALANGTYKSVQYLGVRNPNN